MRILDKGVLHEISGGVTILSISPLEILTVSRPPPPYEDDGYPWIKPPYEPKERS